MCVARREYSRHTAQYTDAAKVSRCCECCLVRHTAQRVPEGRKFTTAIQLNAVSRKNSTSEYTAARIQRNSTPQQHGEAPTPIAMRWCVTGLHQQCRGSILSGVGAVNAIHLDCIVGMPVGRTHRLNGCTTISTVPARANETTYSKAATAVSWSSHSVEPHALTGRSDGLIALGCA